MLSCYYFVCTESNWNWNTKHFDIIQEPLYIFLCWYFVCDWIEKFFLINFGISFLYQMMNSPQVYCIPLVHTCSFGIFNFIRRSFNCYMCCFAENIFCLIIFFFVRINVVLSAMGFIRSYLGFYLFPAVQCSLRTKFRLITTQV